MKDRRIIMFRTFYLNKSYTTRCCKSFNSIKLLEERHTINSKINRCVIKRNEIDFTVDLKIERKVSALAPKY